MIKSVNITNFQGHKETTLEFHPGVNIITGTSDSGKTAILRAINWAANNQPSGNAFRSKWGGETRVEIVLDGDKEVRRIKGKGDMANVYELAQVKGDTAKVGTFKAFGKGAVPEEIAKVLNLAQVNWQRQFDSPFLLNESPGEVARQLNSIANLETIDQSLSNINKMIRSNNQDVSTSEDRLQELSEQIKQFEDLQEVESAIQDLELLKARICTLDKAIEDLESMCGTLCELEEKVEVHNNFLKIEGVVKKLEEKAAEIERLDKEGAELSELIDEIEERLQQNEQADKLLALSGELERLEKIDEELDDSSGELKQLEQIIIQIIKNESWIEECGRQIETLEKQIPDVCPECGQKIEK